MAELAAWVRAELTDVGTPPDGPVGRLLAACLAGEVATSGPAAFGARLEALDPTEAVAVRLGWLLLENAQQVRALEQLDLALALSRHASAAYGHADHPRSAAAALATSAGILRELGRDGEAARSFEQERAVHLALSDLEAVAEADLQIGTSWAFAGAAEPAREALGRAAAWFAEVGDMGALARCDRQLAELARDAGEFPEALDRITAAVGGFEAVDAPHQVAVTRMLRGITLDALGRTDEALADLRAARAAFDEEDSLVDRARTDAVTGEVWFGRGEYAAARQSFAAAVEVFDLLGLDEDAADLRIRLEGLP